MKRARDPWEEFYERDRRRDLRYSVGAIVVAVVALELAIFLLNLSFLVVVPLSLVTGALGVRAGLLMAQRRRR